MPPCKMDKEDSRRKRHTGKRERGRGERTNGRRRRKREEEGGEARAGFRVAPTQDISLGDSTDRRGARLCSLY